MNKINEIKGSNQILTIYDDAVSLKPKGTIGFLTKGISGERFIYFKELSSIQFKNSNAMLSGYIEFYFAGHNVQKQGGGLFAGTTNENRFYFYHKQLENMLKVKKHIEEQMSKKDTPQTQNNISSADEILKYKKLMEDGVITREEFEVKKNQLLGL